MLKNTVVDRVSDFHREELGEFAQEGKAGPPREELIIKNEELKIAEASGADSEKRQLKDSCPTPSVIFASLSWQTIYRQETSLAKDARHLCDEH